MIDPKLQNELRQRFNPDGSELRKMQLRLLDMLKYIDQICQENDINYWLSSGTCLGAIRHGGFIPWDDDVDIEMLESDYNRLMKILLNTEHSEFAIQIHDTDSGYYQDSAKLRDKTSFINESFGIDVDYKYRGLFIDIFRLSESGSVKLHYLCGRLRVLENYVRKASIGNRYINNMMFDPLHFLDNIIISLCKPIDKIFANGERLRHCLGMAFLTPRYKSHIFPLRRVLFEDVELPVPNNYDAYLKTMFGNYMELKQEHVHILSDRIKTTP